MNDLWFFQQTIRMKESDKNKDLGEELADVMFVVLCLANQTGNGSRSQL
jgi:NTP pyrophosphatase (non-canonical NTP hydrolase)